MKIRLLFLLVILSATTLLAQNLVINPSFELTSSNCANLGGEGFGTDLLDWNNANSNTAGDSCSSPDLFSACNVLPFIGGPSPTNMPNSFLGFQRSRTGTRHAGIITYGPGLAAGCTAVGNDNYREYIQGRTSAPLVAGQTYCVSMYVSLGDGVVWATNNIGVRFTNTEYLRDACAGTSSLINLAPQLNYSCPPITDTVNWVRVQWNYTATGGERYFTIGNFYTNANTTIGCSNSAQALINPYAYYYIDDVSITANSCCAATILPQATVCPTDAPYNLVATPPLGTSCSPTVSGTWSGPGITNGSAGTFDPSVAGVGTHTITYILTCGATVTTTIVVGNCATINVCQQPNGDLTVTGGTGPYQWQSPSVVTDCSSCFFGQCLPPICNGVTSTIYTTFASTPTATPPGSVPFRVIDNAGNSQEITTLSGIPTCSCLASILVSGTTVAATCSNPASGGVNLSVSGGTPGYSYAWSNGDSTQNLTGATAGVYSVTITDSAGCTATNNFTIPSASGLLSSVIVNDESCKDLADGAINLSVSGGTAPYTYLWNTNDTTQDLSGLSGGNYTVNITDDAGCVTTQSATVNAGIQYPIIITQSGDTLFASDAPNYQWYLNAQPISGANDSIYIISQGGTYTVSTSVGPCKFGSNQLVITGIDEFTNFATITVFPNPASDNVTVSLQLKKPQKVALTLVDVLGRKVSSTANDSKASTFQFTLSVKEIGAGIYFLNISTENESKSVKVVKQ